MKKSDKIGRDSEKEETKNFATLELVEEICDNCIGCYDSGNTLCNLHCKERQPMGMKIEECGSKECTALQIIARLTVKGYDCIFTVPEPMEAFLIQLTDSGTSHEWFLTYYGPDNFCVEFLPVELFDFEYEVKEYMPVGDAWTILMYGLEDDETMDESSATDDK